MANTAFDHNPTITIPGSGNTTDNAVVLWNGTTGNNFSNSVVIINAGAITGVTALTVDNININGNTIISTDSNGDINLTPNNILSLPEKYSYLQNPMQYLHTYLQKILRNL